MLCYATRFLAILLGSMELGQRTVHQFLSVAGGGGTENTLS